MNLLYPTASWKLWCTLSGIFLIGSIAIFFVFPLRPGIDFAGGSVLRLRGDNVSVPTLRAAAEKQGLHDLTVQSTSDGSVLLRTTTLTTEGHAHLLAEMKKDLPQLEEEQFDTVGPVIGKELLRKAILAIVLASLGIMGYLAYVFRRASSVVSPWAFGSIAVAALLHDVLITSGFFALYAHIFGAAVDSLFITAVLTIIGFSVHDTIVIFNRIKTNLRLLRLPFADVVDRSVLETFTRSINTSMTTLLVILALLFFGGETIRPFIVTLAAGVIVGTYSSVFVAAPLLVWWQHRRNRRG